jgi:hypothetical protein
MAAAKSLLIEVGFIWAGISDLQRVLCCNIGRWANWRIAGRLTDVELSTSA